MERYYKNFKMSYDSYLKSELFKEDFVKLNRIAGLCGKYSITRLSGGRNNRVFSIDYEDGTRKLLKAYFKHFDDKKERLKTEFGFLNFTCSHNIACVPKPLAADYKKNLGLYDFIEGRKPLINEIDKEKIEQALNFFIEINRFKNSREAKSLGNASDSCFSIEEHINHVAKRIEKLQQINEESSINKETKYFLRNCIIKKWGEARDSAKKHILKSNLKTKEFIRGDICISPSDFGYHNSIVSKNGIVYFIDFEYAGFDDPAKMVCDFFSQPEIPVSLEYFKYFSKKVADTSSNPEKCIKRINAVMPLYRIKWCCLMLNIFLEVDSERRNFACAQDNLEEYKHIQLQKAKEYLEKEFISSFK